jgi:hypothetical protein
LDEEADVVLQLIENAATPLWEPMTRPEPDGMGRPVPDTVNGYAGFWNGKIDIFIISTSECVNDTCPIEDEFTFGVERSLSQTCSAQGFPDKSCSGYIVLNAGLLCSEPGCSARLKGTLAHEFFHILQDAHNADASAREAFRIGSNVTWDKSWYTEASATWAAWHYASDPKAYQRFTDSFQNNDLSLLHYGKLHQYASWVWPLLMHLELGPSSVFQSWQEAESATGPRELDDAVDGTFPFADHFRDLSVRNLNPFEYFAEGGVGLEGDVWQTDVEDFPRMPHVLGVVSRIELGNESFFVEVAALAAEDDEFGIAPNVRQVTIDIGSLTNAPNADLDIVGRLAPGEEGGPPAWNRIRGSGTKVTFCRDSADQDFDLVYVVLSNHGRARGLLGGPDPDAALTGTYEIRSKDHCDVPIAYEGTFHSTHTNQPGTWTRDGAVRFEAIEGLRCDVPWIEYCYEAVSAELTVTVSSYEDPGRPGCTVRPHGPLHFTLPEDDPPIDGFLGIVDQSQDPEDDVYSVGLFSAGALPPIQATGTCEDGETYEVSIGPGNFWLLAPGVYGRTGWLLTGSYHAQSSTPLGDATYDEAWELRPIFEESDP